MSMPAKLFSRLLWMTYSFENVTGVPAIIRTEQLSVSKLPIAAQYAQIRDKLLFFSKKMPECLHM